MSAPVITVGYDLSSLGTAAGRRGVGTFIRGLVGAVARRDDVTASALVVDTAHAPVGVEPVPVRRLAPGRLRHVEVDLRTGRELRRLGADVTHIVDTEPPLSMPGPWVATLHDVIPLVVDDPSLSRRRRRWQRLAPRFRRADLVIADSDHSRRTGIAHLGLDPERVQVAHLGVDATFAPEGPAHHLDDDRPYVLLVGEYAWRKGYEEAFAVVDALADGGLPHVLVVCGQRSPWNEPAIERLLATMSHPDRVHLAGYVDDLAAHYRGAALTLVSSRYEGFGLPAAESMACGTPVVSFDNSSLPEVVGDAGILVADGDVAQLAQQVRRVLTDAALGAELRDAGLSRAGTFTWETCAASHIEYYRSVL